jgi:2-polyprenyl-3-methyl-5-hydroxy-6-metoxy-1,4-benzoquinol methylase
MSNPDEDMRVMTVLSELSHITSGWVLDVGCGDGRISLEKALDGCEVVGIDSSAEMIEAASLYRENFEFEHHPEFEVMNGKNIEYSDDTFDLVVCTETLEHMTEDDMVIVISEIKRVLKPDGIILVTVPNQNRVSGTKKYPHLQSFVRDDFHKFFCIDRFFDVPTDKWFGFIANKD